MRNKLLILGIFFATGIFAQNSTYSPYSRYGLGELAPGTFAHNMGMGGAHIALKGDSTMPIFINAGNPASYPLVRLTTLEVGGVYNHSTFKSATSSVTKWNTNFSYGALAFPMGRRGGGCFGIRPYSLVGYDTKASDNEPGIGTVNYLYNGSGGLSNVFVGYGIMPFQSRLRKFRTRQLRDTTAGSLANTGRYRAAEQVNKFLSDLSFGFHGNYIFGSINNTTRVVLPNSLTYNNSFRVRELYVSDFTGNFGAQGAFTFDSIKGENGTRRVLKERVKITFGYFMSLSNPLQAKYTNAVYNYILNSSGQEIVRDTAFIEADKRTSISLPGEQGFGIGFKKGERLNIVADFAITGWQNFKLLESPAGLKNSNRVALGADFVPEKYAFGRNAIWRRIHYRAGVSYQTGYISVNNKLMSDYSVSVGLGFPVGINRLSSMVNVSVRYGRMGSSDPALTSENYFRVHFGFTFCDRWFQKFRYD